jgi:hypothetical protein
MELRCPACDNRYVLPEFIAPTSFFETKVPCEACDATVQINIKLLAIEAVKMYHDEAWLRREYIDKQRTQADIASQFGVTAMAINRWLRIYNIESRPRGWKRGE